MTNSTALQQPIVNAFDLRSHSRLRNVIVATGSKPSLLLIIRGGLVGVVVDETNHTLLIEDKMKEKRLFKKSSKFIFNLPNQKRVEVEGVLLEGRPWDRVKKK